jgi:hypothetical protein
VSVRRHTFELRVVPLPAGDYRLELWEPPAPDTRPPKRRQSTALSSLHGWHLQLAEGLIRRAIEANGIKPGDLKRTRRAPIRLAEEDGVRLDLAFRAITPLRLRTRIEDILHGIHEMSREEALYWHAKVSRSNGTTADNGIMALRILFGGDTRG